MSMSVMPKFPSCCPWPVFTGVLLSLHTVPDLLDLQFGASGHKRLRHEAECKFVPEGARIPPGGYLPALPP